ncbi:MAG: DUF1801 domain-containing protein [Cyclobacteriaceae bacterium]|nr:DUF1801 domain-containing protein [Cyclobacteriaceae bacterium]
MHNHADVDAYMKGLAAADRKALESLRQQIASLMPEAEQRLSRGVPFFYYKGKRAVGFRASKGYLSFFIMEGHVLNNMKHALRDYESSSTVVWFTPDKPLPKALVEKLVKARVTEIDLALNAKKRNN